MEQEIDHDQVLRSRLPPALRRAKILDEAIRLIGEKGYYGFTIKGLADRCNLTNAGLLHHFDNKESLFVAVLEEQERRIVRAIEPLTTRRPGELTYEDSLRVLRTILQLSIKGAELERMLIVLQAEALHTAHPAHEYFSRLEARMLESFALIVTGHCAEPMSIAREIHAMMLGLEQQWLRADGDFDLIAQWDRAISRILPKHSSGRT